MEWTFFFDYFHSFALTLKVQSSLHHETGPHKNVGGILGRD